MSIDVNQSGPMTLADPLVEQGRISSGFVRRDGSYHGGLDIGAPEGTPIYAAESGVVSYAGPRTGYGRYIDIQHFGYDVVTRYGHVRGFAPGIGPGSTVGKGELYRRLRRERRATAVGGWMTSSTARRRTALPARCSWQPILGAASRPAPTSPAGSGRRRCTAMAATR
ncbi:MAG: M23 family metallopeptidase [Deltaproteobacteria bacterium]|nr:M23 family metallopeptidase [Deltaproteobacteria bacterium]